MVIRYKTWDTDSPAWSEGSGPFFADLRERIFRKAEGRGKAVADELRARAKQGQAVVLDPEDALWLADIIDGGGSNTSGPDPRRRVEKSLRAVACLVVFEWEKAVRSGRDPRKSLDVSIKKKIASMPWPDGYAPQGKKSGTIGERAVKDAYRIYKEKIKGFQKAILTSLGNK